MAVLPLSWFRFMLIGRIAQLRHRLPGRQFAIRFTCESPF